jgi:hypothetical protein
MRIIFEDKEDALGLERILGIVGLNSAFRIAVCVCYSACPVMASNLVLS